MRITTLNPLVGSTVDIKPVYVIDSAKTRGEVVAIGHGDGVWVRFADGTENWFPGYAFDRAVIHPENTVTPERVAALSGQSLHTLADALAFYVDSLHAGVDTGLYGDVEESLHVVALEMNRRHGHASEQTNRDVADAVLVIHDGDQVLLDPDLQAGVDWERFGTDRARAFGVLTDRGTSQAWAAMGQQGYTPNDVARALEAMGRREGRKLGFDHSPVRPARLIPADGALLCPPF